MPRINPVTINLAPQPAKPIMEQIKDRFGRVPNIFATLGHCPVRCKK